MAAPIAFVAAAGGATASAGGRPKLEHAFLELRDPPVGKGSLQPGPRRGEIKFQFNPKELAVTKSAKWNRTPQKGSKKSGVPTFEGAEPSKLTLEMFLDASDTQDGKVVETVEKLFACCVPTDETHGKMKAAPPWVIFHWGGLTGFTPTSARWRSSTHCSLPVACRSGVSRRSRWRRSRAISQAEPDLRRAHRDQGPHRRRGRLAGLDRLARVRGSGDVASDCDGEPDR